MSGVTRYEFEVDDRYLCDCGNGSRIIPVAIDTGEYVLASDYDRDTQALISELAALKAGQGEAVAIAECREVHGHMCQFLNHTQHGMDTLRDGDKLYTASPASADAVPVPRELLIRLFNYADRRMPVEIDDLYELRALLAQSE